ncbi:hypothetical protein [Cellvibrio sp. UBA7671]|uniref:hypothetical protein n=1 Tax=Cellvibrio sp. UBA7671 TaxID=1946312 RepID=UPI002F352FB0
MLRLNFSTLPLHQQKLYLTIVLLAGVSFLLGLLWVLLGFSDDAPVSDDAWSTTAIVAPPDTAALYGLIATQPRWYQGLGKKAGGNNTDNQLVQGTPESFRLAGLATKGGKPYALFLPLIKSGGSKDKPYLIQLSEGEALVGDWILKTIGVNQVELQQGKENRILKMYEPTAAPKVKSKRSR